MSNLGWCYFEDEAGTRNMMKNFTRSIFEYFFLMALLGGYCCNTQTKGKK